MPENEYFGHMQKWLAHVLVSSIAVLLTAAILPGVEELRIWDAIIVALVLSFLNAFLKPILVLLTIPATLVTLGLFLLVINACIILVADALLSDFEVRNFWWALLFSLILSIVNSVLARIFGTAENGR